MSLTETGPERVAGRLLLPESRDPKAGRFDPLGAVLSVAGITLLTWSIIEAPKHGWLSATTMGGIFGALVILALFAAWQARRPDPMLDVRLFRNQRFSAASGAIALAFFGLFGFIFMITQYFQIVRGYNPLDAGLATLPFAIITAAFSPIAMIVMRRTGTKLVVAFGLLGDALPPSTQMLLSPSQEPSKAAPGTRATHMIAPVEAFILTRYGGWVADAVFVTSTTTFPS